MRKGTFYLSLFILISFSTFALFLSHSNLHPKNSLAISTSSSPNVLGARTKLSNCQTHDSLPDSNCTPGNVISSATVDLICAPGYSQSVRDVPESVKNQVYSEYGITSHFTGQYEVDHLVSLELGGSNDISNLWPQPADPRPGFHEKDQVENYLHSQVCKGSISLHDAQTKIASNWLQVYLSMPTF